MPNDASDIAQILDDHLAGLDDTVGQTATASAIQFHVRTVDEVQFDFAEGITRLDAQGRPVTEATRFDLASLTKPLVVSMLAMQAVDEGLTTWETRLSDILEAWPSGGARGEITFNHLLSHRSGLPAWRPVYQWYDLDPTAAQVRRTQASLIEDLVDVELDALPGSREEYSDLGYMLLGRALVAVFGSPADEAGELGRLAEDRIFSELGLESLGFRPDRSLEIPATEVDDLRGLVQGRVHDRNAESLGGVAGHAGLFGHARDVAALGAHLMGIARGEVEDGVVSREALTHAWEGGQTQGVKGHHTPGWDTPSGEQSSAGAHMASHRTVGHLGFTGTSIWIDRDVGLVAVLLTNRTYPNRDNDRIDRLRIRAHEAASVALSPSSS
jgi:CubicO group peptidase (beta-lactamase class C family)